MTSKLGIHIIGPHRAVEYDQAIVDAKPCIIKMVAGPTEFGPLIYYHNQIGDDTLYIARIFPYEQGIVDMFNNGASPTDAANSMLAWLANFVDRMGMHWCHFEIGRNEPGDASLYWTDAYYEHLVPLLRAAGIKTVNYNFSVCHPSPLALWGRLKNSLAAIRAAGPEWAKVGLHEGGLFGNMQEYAADGEDARALRHRCIPELADIPVILTELCNDQPAWQEVKPDAAQRYIKDLLWIDGELQKDKNVVGACIYTLDYEPGWEPYRIQGEVADKIFVHIKASHDGDIIEIPPEPEPETSIKMVVVSSQWGCNHRAKPTMNSTQLGYITQGTRLIVEYPAINSYVRVLDKGYVYAPNLTIIGG